MPAPPTMPHLPSESRTKRTCFLALSLLLSAGATAVAQGPPPADPYAAGQDPPNRVARISVTQGNVSLESNGTSYFAPAEVNYPLTNGDRIYCDLYATSELQSSGLAVRLGNAADFTITRLDDEAAQFALAQGSIRLRTRDLSSSDPNQPALEEVDTLNSTVVIQQPGDIRVDAYPQDGSSVVTVTSGQAEVSGPGFDIVLQSGQALRLLGIGQVYPEYVGLLPPDELDQFDTSRERIRDNSIAIRNHYVDPGMIGVADLDQYGDWNPTPQYGPVWFPRNVNYGWSPYTIGHWANVYPWGNTWVDAQPWGFAPFHYGRWNNFGGRWGWVPGPPPSVFRGPGWGGRPPRPVYSPALVAFVGGGGFSVSVGGVNLTAWFPLGPSEPYTPWYHTSPAYVNRVNVTNVYNTNVTEIHNTYVTRNVTVYNVTNVTYVNRSATVVVNQRDFAAGHAVAQSAPAGGAANFKAQLVSQPVLTHAAPPPPRAPTPPPAPARAVPANVSRPVVQTKEGFQRAGAPPAASPLKAPVPQPVKAGAAAPPPPPPRPTLAPAKTAVPVARPATAPPPSLATPEPGGHLRTTPPAPPVAAPVVRPNPEPPAKPAPAPVVRSTPQPPARPAIEAPTKPAVEAPTRPAIEPPARPAIEPGLKPAPVPLAKPAPTPVPTVAPRPVPPVVPPAAKPAPPAPNRKMPPAREDKPGEDKPKPEKPN